MGTVDVSVGHQNDLVIAELAGVEIFFTDPRSQRHDQRLDFAVAQHLVESRLLDIEDLALQRKDRLVLPVASLLSRSTCRVALDDVDLGQGRIALLAVGELSGKHGRTHRALAHDFARLPGSLASPSGVERLADNLPGNSGILLEELRQPFVQERLHGPLHVGIELALCLPFKLRLRQLDGNHRHQTFANIIPGQRALEVLGQTRTTVRRR